MSRSRYRNPFMGVTGRSSCKAWRTQENRRYRAYAKNEMRHGRYDNIQGFCGNFGNEWASPRDGRVYFGDYKGVPCIDKTQHPEWRWWSWINDRYGCWVEKDVHFCHKAYLELLRK